MFPNSDPVMFMVAFYGCFLAELVPVPIEVPLTRKVACSGLDTGSGPVSFGGVFSVLGSGQQMQSGCRFPFFTYHVGEKGH